MPSAVAVTGAAGYVGAHVVRILLEKGYTVRGSVRSLSNEKLVKPLKELFPKLELFEADLLKEGSFDEMFKDCETVMHVASPFTANVTDPEQELIRPAVEGTLNVLTSCLKVDSVKNVVVTSSVAAVLDPEAVEPGKIYSEKDWNETSKIEHGGMPAYRVSKTKAERAAWKFVEDNKATKALQLAVINPFFVIGPPLLPREDGTSIGLMKTVLSGGFTEKGAHPVSIGVVDVRDVALAHVQCLSVPDAYGNRCIAAGNGGNPIKHIDIADMLREKFGKYPLPDKVNGEQKAGMQVDTTRLNKVMGIPGIPVKQSLEDMATFLIANGMVPKKE